MRLSDIAAALSQVLSGEDKLLQGISIDSRTIKQGEIFIAIQGENFDGHAFVDKAVRAGAAGVVVAEQQAVDVPQFIVKDTTKALGRIAQYWRRRMPAKVIAITGSHGKTTVRNMVASILMAAHGQEHVLAAKKSFNNCWGMPLTLCGLTENHCYAVLELGMNHLGEIAELTEICEPDVAAITLAAPAHLEGVGGTIAGVAQAKGELLVGLAPSSVVALNYDDAFYHYWDKLLTGQQQVTFGFSDSAMFTAKNVGMQAFCMVTPKGEVEISLPMLGRHNMHNALAAAAVALAADQALTLEQIKKGLESVVGEPGRIELKQASAGAVIIDDSYNSSVASIEAALEVLSQQSGYKIAVLADMGELGEHKIAIHQSLAGLLAKYHFDQFVAVGPLMKHAYDAYQGPKLYFAERSGAIHHLQDYSLTGNVLLVKGSRSMGMEEIVQSLTSC